MHACIIEIVLIMFYTMCIDCLHVSHQIAMLVSARQHQSVHLG